MRERGIPELPERICVETRFISREAAKIQNLNYVDLRTISHLNGETNNASQLLPTITPFPNIKALVSEEVMTDNPNPVRDRGLQTEIETATIAIQCNWNEEQDDLEFNKFFEEPINVEKAENISAENKRFLQFIQDKTIVHSNGKFECLVCGEVKANSKLMESHMALHYGPKKLCFRCGLCFEHKILWKIHNCVVKRSNKIQRIKCPYNRCAASLISPLEFYDHLNEHCGISIHTCYCCKRSFPTSGELLYHQKLHKKCSSLSKASLKNVYKLPAEDSKYRKRISTIRTRTGKKVIVKTSLSQLALKSNRLLLCNICMKRCSSLSHYQMHMKRCLEIYNRRLKQKRLSAALSSYIANGVINEH